MRKKRILWVNDASWKGTGYGTYGNEVLSRLHQVPEFEIAELACYADGKDSEANPRPWKVYTNRPPESDPSFANYVNNPTAVFGQWTFNAVCLDFKPDIVMDIRDWWMFEYQERSPFRDFFHWAIMPTVDATPQNPQWLSTFGSADSVFAYSEFGRDVMLEQSDKINFVDVASPAASEKFSPVPDKRAHKDAMGLDADSIIVGTVMRNQRRKLYPDLFAAFRKFLDRSKRNNVFLHCHTYYPDIGWEVPALLDQFGLTNRVLFSYKCNSCKKISIDFFKDCVSYCPSCSEFANRLVGVENSVDTKELADIYNCFDLYVQYANSEGFGMPQLEAAYCGVPVMSMNYSAMESVIRNIKAEPLNPLHLSMECETGCYRAIPDNEELVDRLRTYTNPKIVDLRKLGLEMASNARQHYDWDKTAQMWIDHFKTVPIRDHSETWDSPISIKPPATTIPNGIVDLKEQINYIFSNVLHKPEWIGGYFWSKVIKDITFGYRVHNSEDDYYFHESHVPQVDKYQKFNMVMAVQELTNLRNEWNKWEQIRGNRR